MSRKAKAFAKLTFVARISLWHLQGLLDIT